MLTRHCGDHFTMYKNIKSLCCTLRTNIILYFNYTSIQKRKYSEDKSMTKLLRFRSQIQEAIRNQLI